jgi:hypothetical protein
LTELIWICELSSSPAGYPAHRYIAQGNSKVDEQFFKLIDFDGYELGRLGREIQIVEKMKDRGSKYE